MILPVLFSVFGCGANPETSEHKVADLTQQKIVAENPGNELIGKVVGVTDGDTIEILDESNETHKIRLTHIDAPERGQDFGTQAKKFLSDQVFGKSVRVDVSSEKDRYGRVLGEVWIGDVSANQTIVLSGFAWHYKKYSTDDVFANAETAAKNQKLGLWAHANPIAPWDFRKGVRPSYNNDSVADQKSTGYWLSTNSGVRHNKSCRWFEKSKGRPCSPTEGKPCKLCGG